MLVWRKKFINTGINAKLNSRAGSWVEKEMNQLVQAVAANFFSCDTSKPVKLTAREFSRNYSGGLVKSVKLLDYPMYYKIEIGGNDYSTYREGVFTELNISTGQKLKGSDVIGMYCGPLVPRIDDVKEICMTASNRLRAELLLEVIKYWGGKPVVFSCPAVGRLATFSWEDWQKGPEWNEAQGNHWSDDPFGWSRDHKCDACKVTRDIVCTILGGLDTPIIKERGHWPDTTYIDLRVLKGVVEKF